MQCKLKVVISKFIEKSSNLLKLIELIMLKNNMPISILIDKLIETYSKFKTDDF